IARITKEARSEVLTEYLTIKYTNFNTIVSFLNHYIVFRKRIKDAKFIIDSNFEVTFLYNTVKTAYPIDARYWAVALEANELDIGSILVKLSNISNIE
ncbi:hypothetical protein GE21DRAFT_1170581, partial [Neurospora crassa]